MGNSLRGNVPWSNHERLGSNAFIDITREKIETEDGGGYSQEWIVSYTINGSRCTLYLDKYVDERNRIREVILELKDDICFGGMRIWIERVQTNFLDVDYQCSKNFQDVMLYKTDESTTSSQGYVMSRVFNYCRRGKGGLVVVEWWKKSRYDAYPYTATVAHYYANFSRGSYFNQNITDIGISMIVNVWVSNKNLDIKVEGPDRHPSGALFSMFEQVSRSGIWYRTACPHCADIQRLQRGGRNNLLPPPARVHGPAPPRSARSGFLNNEGFRGNCYGDAIFALPPPPPPIHGPMENGRSGVSINNEGFKGYPNTIIPRRQILYSSASESEESETESEESESESRERNNVIVRPAAAPRHVPPKQSARQSQGVLNSRDSRGNGNGKGKGKGTVTVAREDFVSREKSIAESPIHGPGENARVGCRNNESETESEESETDSESEEESESESSRRNNVIVRPAATPCHVPPKQSVRQGFLNSGDVKGSGNGNGKAKGKGNVIVAREDFVSKEKSILAATIRSPEENARVGFLNNEGIRGYHNNGDKISTIQIFMINSSKPEESADTQRWQSGISGQSKTKSEDSETKSEARNNLVLATSLHRDRTNLAPAAPLREDRNNPVPTKPATPLHEDKNNLVPATPVQGSAGQSAGGGLVENKEIKGDLNGTIIAAKEMIFNYYGEKKKDIVPK